MPPLNAPSSAAVMKWIGFAVVMAGGAFNIFKGDLSTGLELVGAALWIGGATTTLQRISARSAVVESAAAALEEHAAQSARTQATIRDDVRTIKDAPNLPGVPLGEPR